MRRRIPGSVHARREDRAPAATARRILGLVAAGACLLALSATAEPPAPPRPADPADAGTGESTLPRQERGDAGANDGAAGMEMVDILRRIAERGTPLDDPRRLQALEREIAATTDLKQRVDLVFHLGREFLMQGRTEDAIGAFLSIRDVFDRPGVDVHPDVRRRLGEHLAVAYLRLGEQENCIAHHNPTSCLLPIAREARHGIERGARGAVGELEALMRTAPDLGSRWLLNIAAMTLGEYPEGVREEWRIPPEAFASEYELPRFEDRAGAAGVDHFSTAGGVVMEDLDGDGLLDLVVSAWGAGDQLHYFHSRGDGTFEDQTEAAGLVGELGGLNLIHADYDNDGRADILVLRGAWLGPEGRHPNSLLRNVGPGPNGVVRFRDVTKEAGLLSFFPTQTADWADFDLDGWLDLFVGNESGPGMESPSQLYRNNGDGTFSDVAAECGVDVRAFVKGAVWGDVDRDGRPDLYLSCLGEKNQLFLNQGPGPDGRCRFTEIGQQAGVVEPMNSFPTWFWDYDNDGWLDLLVAPYSGFLGDSLTAVVADVLELPNTLEQGRLYRNLGAQPGGAVRFRDVTSESGLDRPLLAMGANFGDLDNDGWLDAYFGTGEPNPKTLVPNRMFRNDGGRRFQDVTTAGGFGHLQKGHAIAFGALDNDGQQEVYAVMGGAYPGDTYYNALFVNPGNGNAWVMLVLEGVTSNRGAVGARVRVVARGPDGERSIWRTVGTGGSFGSSSLRLEVGLGDAHGIDRVEVAWPNAASTVETFRGLEPRAHYRLREAAGKPRRLELPRFSFAAAADTTPHGAGNHR